MKPMDTFALNSCSFGVNCPLTVKANRSEPGRDTCDLVGNGQGIDHFFGEFFLTRDLELIGAFVTLKKVSG